MLLWCRGFWQIWQLKDITLFAVRLRNSCALEWYHDDPCCELDSVVFQRRRSFQRELIGQRAVHTVISISNIAANNFSCSACVSTDIALDKNWTITMILQIQGLTWSYVAKPKSSFVVQALGRPQVVSVVFQSTLEQLLLALVPSATLSVKEIDWLWNPWKTKTTWKHFL